MKYIAINNRIYHISEEDLKKIPKNAKNLMAFDFIYDNYKPYCNPNNFPTPNSMEVSFIFNNFK